MRTNLSACEPCRCGAEDCEACNPQPKRWEPDEEDEIEARTIRYLERQCRTMDERY